MLRCLSNTARAAHAARCDIHRTLTAASVVVLLDPVLDPTAEAQAIGRCHRLGQTRTVHVYRFVCNATVEVDIARLANVRRGVAGSAVATSGVVRQEGQREDDQIRSATLEEIFCV